MLSGIPAAQNWVKYHGETGRLRRRLRHRPVKRVPRRRGPGLFRYQVQGPQAQGAGRDGVRRAAAAVEVLPLGPGDTGRLRFRALRHNMAGQDGYEFIGPLGARRGGQGRRCSPRARSSASCTSARSPTRARRVESGWIPVAGPRHLHRPGARGLPRVAAAVRHRGAAAAERQLLLRGHRGLLRARRTSSATAGRSPSTTTSSAATRCSRRRTPRRAPRSRWCSTRPTWPRCSA